MTRPRPTLSAAARSRLTRLYLRRLTWDDKPILFGPFRSEVGFEGLYWIPFLRWACQRYGFAPERCIAVSRGGMGALYPAAKAVDLFSLRTVDEVRIENQVDLERQKMLKQLSVTAWDRDVLAEAAREVLGGDAADRIPRRAYHVLHPSWMYWLFEPTWDERATVRHVASHAEFGPLPIPALPEGVTLPPKYIAVKFYERHTFPFHPQVQTLVREMVQGLASKFAVVLLGQPHFVDDHTDLPLSGPNIQTLPAAEPASNLLLQAAVLARAQAFVGTYGGVAQLALLYRKPSLSFYTHFGGTLQAHRTLSQVLAAQVGVPFEVADLRAVKLWHAVLGPVTQPDPEPQAVAA